MLDCHDFCTAEYKAVLAGPRGAEALIDEHRAGISKRQKLEQAAKARRCSPLPNRFFRMLSVAVACAECQFEVFEQFNVGIGAMLLFTA